MKRSTVRRRAFEAVFVSEMPTLYRAARRRLRSDADAEDVVQETMLRAYRAFDEDDPPENPAAWCHTILTNILTDRARSDGRQPDTLSVDDEGAGIFERLVAGRETGMFSDPQRLIERWGNRDEVRAALDELPVWAREVLVLAHVSGLKYREIAQTLDIPEGTVMSRLTRARRALERALAGRVGLPDANARRVPADTHEGEKKLDSLEKEWGEVPPGLEALASQPNLLDAASTMMASVVEDGALPGATKRVLLASLAGHDVDTDDIALSALVRFFRQAASQPASLTQADYDVLYAEGWSAAQVTEVLHLSAFAPYVAHLNQALGGPPQ